MTTQAELENRRWFKRMLGLKAQSAWGRLITELKLLQMQSDFASLHADQPSAVEIFERNYFRMKWLLCQIPIGQMEVDG